MDPKFVLTNLYGLNDCTLTKLEGYNSINYKVNCSRGVFVLKQYSYTDREYALLKAENCILEKLSALDEYEFSAVVPSNTKATSIVNDKTIFRLLSYVEGSFLGDIFHTPRLLRSLGVFLAKLDKNLQGTYEPSITARETPWDLRNFKQNYSLLKYIPDPKDRSLVDYFFLQYDENIYPIQHEFRKGIIHNDGNDWNVLTKNGLVSGIIDFGDMCDSWLINEVAVAITYVMMGKENPLEMASFVIEGYQTIFPLNQQEVDALYYLVAARLCTSVCNSAYSKTLKPDSKYITISEKPAWDLLRKWLTINPRKAQTVFRKAVGFSKTARKPLKGQLERRKATFSEALSLSYSQPIEMQRSAFQYMYDTDGNTFLDAYNNIMLAGHSHPTVVRAAQKTMGRLNTNTRYIYEELLAYSEQLLKRFPEKLNKVFFVNSGSAASDLAIRLAMTHSKKNMVMVLEHGYHGNTRNGIDISHYKYDHVGGSGKQNFVIETTMPKAFECGYADDGAAGKYYAQTALEKINTHSGSIAAFIAEPIVGCGGQVPLAKGYLKEIYPKIREQGGICISDEVQVGFGRLGDFFWGYEMHGVIPDMVVLGKPMGNGHPIGAVVTTTAIADSFDNGLEFFSSFGGNPVSCAIGNAVLRVIEDENLQDHAKETGDYLKSLLITLQKTYPQLADIRGNGLFLGVEIFDLDGKPDTRLALRIKNQLRKKHILIGTDGPFDSVLKIKPPLRFSKADCDLLVSAIESILCDIRKK